MAISSVSAEAQRWHSSDFLVRIKEQIAAGVIGSAELTAADSFRPNAWLEERTSDERLSAIRSWRFPTPQVISFGARNCSTWALDLLTDRISGGLNDWASLRAALVRFGIKPRDFDPTLDRLAVADLWGVLEVLRERDMDQQAEQGLVRFLGARVASGQELKRSNLLQLMERLLSFGFATDAQALHPRLNGRNWRERAISAELEHPRFGGSYEAMLINLNQGFYQHGLERITLSGEGQKAFPSLATETARPLGGGPTVTVIMVTHQPGREAVAAAQSVVRQSYQNWELVVIDDGSSRRSGPVLDEIAGLDSRVRVVREPETAGIYIRRNEAIRQAESELVTFQDAGAWSHPRRLETQVRDLHRHSGSLANVIRAAAVSDEFSMVARRDASLFLGESSLLFRRDPILQNVGLFDSVLGGAGTEFRLRIEAVSGTTVKTVGPEVPLQFVSAQGERDAERDFNTGHWVDPEWLSYMASFKQRHESIRSGTGSPYGEVAAAHNARSRRGSSPSGTIQTDVLLIADARWTDDRADFINALVDEIQTAASAGLQIALCHSDSLGGAKNAQPIAGSLQTLIDTGKLVRVVPGQEMSAFLAVVRHAGAAQGHVAERLTARVKHVVVVEDRNAGDVRSETVAESKVTETVTAWFGQEPTWTKAQPIPPRPKRVSAVVEGDDIRVTMQAADPEQITAIRIGAGGYFTDLDTTRGEEGFLVGVGSLVTLPAGDLFLGVLRRETGYQDSIQGCWISGKSVVTYRSQRLLIPNAQRGLRLLPPTSTQDSIGTEEFITRHLQAQVTRARVFRDHLELTLAYGSESQLTAVYGLREVDGHIRQRNFPLDKVWEGGAQGVHALDDILETRWKIFGSFQTPYGPVEFPIEVNQETPTEDSAEYRIRKLRDHGVGVLHVVPKAVKEQEDKDPVLSVVMPVFNVGPFLDTAIRSVLTQDFDDFELIIVDDASTDDGRKIIEMHASLDPRIRFIGLDHNTLGGAGVPSNLGIRAARGKYVAFVDSDDWVTKGAFARMIELAEENDAELVIGDFRTFGQNERDVADAYDSVRWRDIPLGEVISASSHPSLFRLSPVPWRKLYRNDFMQAHHVLYPEGDYFYEDNPLHWQVLSRARRIVACDEIVSYHRMEREGQTMGAHAYKLGAITSHANTILNVLAGSTAEYREVLFEEFIDYVSRQRWIVRRQTQKAAADILKHRLTGLFEKALEIEPATNVPQEIAVHFAGYRDAYPDLDLTVVMPVYNSADLLRESLDSVLKLEGLRYNVILIDDGSTDNSLEIMREYEKKYSNVHVFEQKNRGAGRARNAVIPLCTGRYTYFLDADDVIDASALREAVQKATRENSDLLFVKYQIEFTDEKRTRDMFNDDAEIWRQLPDATELPELQSLVAGLINYPWNRVIRTSVLHDANIFFGPTVVHNDVLFHWHSILAAQSIGFLDAPVCTHRKFQDRAQVTNIVDERRMAVLEALRGTHQRISDLSSYEAVREQWRDFARGLLDWAEKRIPESSKHVYRERAAELAQSLAE